VAPPCERTPALAISFGDQLDRATALADPRLARHYDELGLTCPRGLQRISELSELDLAADQR
jgi:hypothetical protein